MPSVALQSDQIIKQQGEEILLLEGTSYKSTKTQAGKGRWYYEFTHINGSQSHLVGFSTSSGGIYFYPQAQINKPRMYPTGTFINSSDLYYFPFSMTPIHTAGIGIDLEENRFYVYYNHSYFAIDFPPQQSKDGFNAHVWGANHPLTYEVMTINYGYTSFQYNICGFTPWQESSRSSTITCMVGEIFSHRLIDLLVCSILISHN